MKMFRIIGRIIVQKHQIFFIFSKLIDWMDKFDIIQTRFVAEILNENACENERRVSL